MVALFLGSTTGISRGQCQKQDFRQSGLLVIPGKLTYVLIIVFLYFDTLSFIHTYVKLSFLVKFSTN